MVSLHILEIKPTFDFGYENVILSIFQTTTTKKEISSTGDLARLSNSTHTNLAVSYGVHDEHLQCTLVLYSTL